MAQVEVNRKRTTEKKELSEKSSLKGTLTSVMIMGALIIVSWFGVWALYLSR